MPCLQSPDWDPTTKEYEVNTTRTNAVQIQMALDAAERQGRDVIAVIPCHSGLEGWGRRPTTWCLLFHEKSVEPYCVAPHYEGDVEFGNGGYFRDLESAQKHFLQRVRREWLDAKIHAESVEA